MTQFLRAILQFLRIRIGMEKYNLSATRFFEKCEQSYAFR